jgi:hypothetical protein
MPNPASAGLPNPAKYSVDAAKGVVIDTVTGLMWQEPAPRDLYSWAEAMCYCASLGSSTGAGSGSVGYAGYADWRLPTRIELVSLVDYTVTSGGAMVNAAAFPSTASAPGGTYWTSSLRAGGGFAWWVDFSEGLSQYSSTFYDPGGPVQENGDLLGVRCVR